MIKTFLKHWVYEFCIEQFFENVQNNFHIFDKNLSIFSVGDHMQLKVIFEDTIRDFAKCKVIYKKGKQMIIESLDFDVPLRLVMIKNDIIHITVKTLDNLEDYFDDDKLKEIY